MRTDLHTWIPHNIVWIHLVATPLLCKKKCKLNLYLDFIISNNSLIDEIALTMVTKMYSMHIGVLFCYDYWTTNKNKDLEMCQIVFAYQGKLKFALTQELEEIMLKNYVSLSVIDCKGKEHPLEIINYDSFLNKGPEAMECLNPGGDFDVISNMDYYRDRLSPLTIKASDCDYMSGDLADDAVISDKEPEHEIMDVVCDIKKEPEHGHADHDSEIGLSAHILNDSSKEPEPDANHDSEPELSAHVLNDSSKETEPDAYYDSEPELSAHVLNDSSKETEPDAYYDSEPELSAHVLNYSSKEPEPDADHHSESEHVLNNSSKEPEPDADHHSESEHVLNDSSKEQNQMPIITQNLNMF